MGACKLDFCRGVQMPHTRSEGSLENCLLTALFQLQKFAFQDSSHLGHQKLSTQRIGAVKAIEN